MTRWRRSIAALLAAVLYVQGAWAVAPPVPLVSPVRLALAPAVFPGAPGALRAPEAPAAPDLEQAVSNAAIQPILECIVPIGEGMYRGYFGYRSDNTVPVTVPVGSDNRFILAPLDRGQPTTFQPGRSPGYPNATFSSTFFLLPYVWTVENGGHRRFTAATLFSPRCAPQPAPAISITTPAANANVSGPNITVTGSITGGTRPNTVSVNGAAASVSGNNYTATLTNVPNGSLTITATVRDTENRTAIVTRTITVGVPNTPPVISLTAPVSGLTLRSPIAVTGTVSGPGPLSVTVNGTTAPIDSGAFAGSLTAPDGAFAITAVATGAGNLTATATANVLVDSTPPVITVTEPADGQYVSAETITVMGGVTDATVVSVTINGAPATMEGAAFSGIVTVGDGPTTAIAITATDAAGNTTQHTRTLNVDRAVPVVTITSPADGAFVKGLATVAGTATDASGVTIAVNGEFVPVVDGAFTASVAVPDGPFTIAAVATDAAGNIATASRSVNGDSIAPALVITEPAPGAITNQSTIRVAGTVTDASPVVLQAGGATVVPVNGAFDMELPLLANTTSVLIVTATDAAGNEALADVAVVSDRVPPELAITNPSADAVVSALPLVMQGTVQDMTTTTVTVNGTNVPVAGSTWETSIAALPEGAASFAVIARDAAGNQTETTTSILVDLGAPVVTIESPGGGTLSRETEVTVTGSVTDASLVSLTINGVAATMVPGTAGNAFTFSAVVPLSEGDNHLVAVALDRAGREGVAHVDLTRDTTPPAIELTLGQTVTTRRPAAASVVASDSLALDRVTIAVNGINVGTFTAPPFTLDIAAPAGVQTGDVVNVVAEAIDRAGNRSQASGTVRVAADGAVVGQVLDDATGKPLAGAQVEVDDLLLTTDARGRYTFSTGSAQVQIRVSADGKTSVERTLDVASAAGTVALDARLTPLALPVTPPFADQQLAVGAMTLVVPDAAYAAGASIRATALSGQGLPGLLPMGWSPIAALDLRGPAPASPIGLRASSVLPVAIYLARYEAGQWRLASAALTPVDGVVSIELPSADALVVALVVPDTGDGAPIVPAIGEALPASATQAIPMTATSAGVLDPPTLSPGGGTSIGTLTVTSPTPLPSGTVVQAVVTETFTLANGDTISEDARTQDFILYRAGAALSASFPVVPARSFATAELATGIVHLDILAGRESVRGSAGGSEAATLTTTGATLAVAAGALSEDVPLTFQSAVLSSFLPSTPEAAPVLEFALDFSGRTLTVGADLSVEVAQIPALGANDTLVIARIAQLDGRSRLVPVAIGELVGDRYFARARHGLPGVIRGGRHVWYRVAGDIGFVVGVTDAGGTPVSAVVDTNGLPFAAIGATDGRFTLVARAGSLAVAARVPGTSLVGSTDAVVTAGAEVVANIALAGDVSAATVTPVTGAIAISPATQVEITSPAPIAPASLTTATVTFTQVTAPSAAVPFRVVLSGSGRSLAIVPLARLLEGAEYTVSVTGLADAVGGAIVVPATTFTTQSNTSPVYDLERLVFSFPNEQGEVTLTGPPGTLAPGSTIIVVNETTGEVSTLPVFNDGSVGGFLVAQISDRLIVTITDLLGRQTVFKRSEYVAPDGTTAVGHGGGGVEAPGGVEVRIPEDAVMNGVAAILKIAAMLPQELPPGFLPEIPDATMATVLKIESPNPPAFEKEVDLAFPKPADAPAEAVYFVYRRMTGPNGQIAYEALDYADVEGEGADAKVVTASYPFSGYRQSVNGYSLNGIDHGGAIGSQFDNYAVLMWGFDNAMPGRALGGVVTGKVLRVKYAPGASTPTYEPVEGALISGVDVTGQPLFAQLTPGNPPTIAVSQADGTYSLFDRQYTGGTVTISATIDSATRTATAYEVNPQDAKSPGLRFARNVATANITFPAVAPDAPPSPVQMRVMTLDAEGKRKATTGIVIAGEPLVLGVIANDLTIQRIEVKSGTETREYAVRVDPLAGQDPMATGVIADGPVSFALPGTYTVKATAVGAFGGVVTGHVVIRAVAPGGSNNDSLPSDPPLVITAQTKPKADAAGVAIGVLPQIVFSEPVKNLPGAVTLVDAAGGSVGITLSGVGPNGAIESLSASSIVTSITVQPMAGLKYGTRYTLSLSSAIEDTDKDANNQPAPKSLEAYSTSFTTFAPEAFGSTEEAFTAGGMAVVGDRAYLATPQVSGRWFTNLRLFDVADPTLPQEIAGAATGSQINTAPPAFWLGLPVDLAAQPESSLTGGTLVAVASNPLSYPYHPANVRLYDVTDDQSWKWIGAVTLGREPSDGMIRRIELKGSTLYAATAGMGKGIQVVDLGVAQDAFSTATSGGEQSAGFWQMQGRLNGSDGFGQEAIAQTIHVDTGSGQNSQLWDLAVTDLAIDSVTQPAVIATGRSPLVVANPQTGELLYNGEILDVNGASVTSWGYGIAAGDIDGTPIAVVSTVGPTLAAGGHVLAVVDLTNPRQPVAVGSVLLPGSGVNVHDVVLRDSTVFVGTTTGTLVVNIGDLAHPQLVARIPGVSGRLAFSADGLLFGTYRGLTQVTNPEGGLRAAALAPFLSVSPDQTTVLFDEGKTLAEVKINYRLIGASEPATSLRVDVLRETNPVQQLPSPFDGERGETVWPYGSAVQMPAGYFVRAIANEGTADEILSRSVRLPVTDLELFVEKQRAAMVAAAIEGSTPIENTWDESGRGIEPPVNGFDYKNSSRTFVRTLTTAFGAPPNLPTDYVLITIKAASGLIWEETGGTTIRLDVPSSGRVEATLKATAELAALQAKEITISTEYFADDRATKALKLTDETIQVLNQRLHGHIANMVAGVFGRGEGFEARVAELGVALVPFAGDAAGIIGELVNALDPQAEAGKVNAALSVAGLATEAGVFAGPAGVAMDKVVAILRVGLRQVANVTGPLRTLPTRVWTLVKARTWDDLLNLSQGSLKFAWLAGGELAARIVREENDIASLDRVVKRYSDDIVDTTFAELLVRVDGVFADPDAVRGVVRVLSDFKDASGGVIRLSDDAVEGAVKFLALIERESPPEFREGVLRALLVNGPSDAETVLKLVKGANDPQAVKGIGKYLSELSMVPCPVTP